MKSREGEPESRAIKYRFESWSLTCQARRYKKHLGHSSLTPYIRSPLHHRSQTLISGDCLATCDSSGSGGNTESIPIRSCTADPTGVWITVTHALNIEDIILHRGRTDSCLLQSPRSFHPANQRARSRGFLASTWLALLGMATQMADFHASRKGIRHITAAIKRNYCICVISPAP
jgi:hypothetical protein